MVARRPERAEGPVLGTLYTLNGSVLKLTAQLLAAAFRVTGWDGAAEHRSRVLWGAGTAEEQAFEGTVAADPAADGELRVGLLDCTIHSYRPLNVASDVHDRMAGSRPLGLHTEANLYFPTPSWWSGDQYYEHRPTTKEQGPEPTRDLLYRWYLWLWAFRDLTREVPAVVLVDDHDVYHPNLWATPARPPRRATTARAATSPRPPGSTWSSGSRPTSGGGPSSTRTPTPPWPPAAPRRPGAGQAGRGAAPLRRPAPGQPGPPRPRPLRRRPGPVRRPGPRQRLAALVRAGRRPAESGSHPPHRRLHRRLRQPHAGPGRGQPRPTKAAFRAPAGAAAASSATGTESARATGWSGWTRSGASS
jgi:hypothetical protein